LYGTRVGFSTGGPGRGLGHGRRKGATSGDRYEGNGTGLKTRHYNGKALGLKLTPVAAEAGPYDGQDNGPTTAEYNFDARVARSSRRGIICG